jgi:hypothetical protein
MKLHNIRLPDQPKSERPQRHSTFYANISPGFPACVINPLVHNPSLSGKQVFVPHSLNMDQGALPFAEEQVLQGGQRDKVVF